MPGHTGLLRGGQDVTSQSTAAGCSYMRGWDGLRIRKAVAQDLRCTAFALTFAVMDFHSVFRKN